MGSLVNLKSLTLGGKIDKDEFNFGLFKHICNQLEILSIQLDEFDNEYFVKLFYGLNFLFMKRLFILFCFQFTKLETKFFDGFSSLQYLHISINRRMKTEMYFPI